MFCRRDHAYEVQRHKKAVSSHQATVWWKMGIYDRWAHDHAEAEHNGNMQGQIVSWDISEKQPEHQPTCLNLAYH